MCFSIEMRSGHYSISCKVKLFINSEWSENVALSAITKQTKKTNKLSPEQNNHRPNRGIYIIANWKTLLLTMLSGLEGVVFNNSVLHYFFQFFFSLLYRNTNKGC